MGGLNGLINNAGILRDGLLVKKDRTTGAITKLTKEQWDAVIGVNLTGATLMVRDVVAKMVATEQRPGVIVNMSSSARHGNRGQSNYSAAKAALATNTVTCAQDAGVWVHLTSWEGQGHVPYAANRSQIVQETTSFLWNALSLRLIV